MKKGFWLLAFGLWLKLYLFICGIYQYIDQSPTLYCISPTAKGQWPKA
jgi:hypothetical protein